MVAGRSDEKKDCQARSRQANQGGRPKIREMSTALVVQVRWEPQAAGCVLSKGSRPRFAPASSGSGIPSVRRATRYEQSSMKKDRANDRHPEYDFSSMNEGIRGKYVARYRAGTNLVLLDPEVAEAFPTDAAVNQTLCAVLEMANEVRLPSRARTSRRRGRR
jgi:hypothetical protein